MNSTVHRLFQEQTTDMGKRHRTRSALLDSAISVVASKGFEAAKITDVTTHAGMANGTFYNHFEDKDHLMREVAIGLALAVTKKIDQEMSTIDDAVNRVIIGTAKFIEIARSEPEWMQVLMNSIDVIPEIQSGFVQFLKEDLELGVKQGNFVIAIDVLLINQIIALSRVAIVLNDTSYEETSRKTCAAILRLLGISAARAEKRVIKALRNHAHLIA